MATSAHNPPRYVICCCQHCDGNIEFDANLLDEGEKRPIECPHCNVETLISVPIDPPPEAPSPVPPAPPAPPVPAATNFQSSSKGGLLGYFGLGDWWQSEFIQTERKYIGHKFNPPDDNPQSLTEGEITSTTQTASGLLINLAGSFEDAEDFSIGKRILDKALQVSGSVLDRHAAYAQMIRICYRALDDGALPIAIDACNRQVALAVQAADAFRNEFPGSNLPEHLGYAQLATISEMEKDYEGVIQLCKQARQQGWAGDWDARIARCEEKRKSSG